MRIMDESSGGLWRSRILFAVTALLYTVRCQCPPGSASFEKVAGSSLRGVRLSPLFKGTQGAVTRECLERCRAQADCNSLLLSYTAFNCMKSDQTSQGRKGDVVTSSPPSSTSYFEKICLTAPRCPRLWTFERVIGFEISGFDDRTVPGVPSRLQCQELCLRERGFVCRSGEYDYGFQQCRLSSEDRRSQPSSFRPAFGDVDYFENQCVTDGSTGCDYEEKLETDVEREDVYLTSQTQSECQQECDRMDAFLCHSYSFRPSTSSCKLSSDDTFNLGSSAIRRRVGSSYFERANCLDLKLTCTDSSMQLVLRTRDPFDGRIYSQASPHTCQVYGDKHTVTRFVMDVRGQCGVQVEGEDRLANTVVVQYHPLIQQKGDRIIKLYCSLFEDTNRTLTKTFRVSQGKSFVEIGARQLAVYFYNDPLTKFRAFLMAVIDTSTIWAWTEGGFCKPWLEPAATAVVNATAPTPNIRLRITDANGTDITGTRIGEPLFFRIEIDEDSVFGIFARDMNARNGRGDQQIQLINSDGCSLNSRIFPVFDKIPGTKSLQSRFQAFKFSEDPVVRFQVNVHFCLEECTPVICPEGQSWGRRRKRRISPTEEIPIVPDYPLVAAIVVEGTRFGNSTNPSESQYGGLQEQEISDELVCTTKTVVVVTSLGALFLQIGLLAACGTCLLLTRKERRPHYPEDSASTITQTLPPFSHHEALMR